MRKPFLPYLATIVVLILGGLLPKGLLSLYDSRTLAHTAVKEVVPVAFYSARQSFDTLVLLAKEHTLRPLASSYTSLTTAQVADAAIERLVTLQDLGLYHAAPSSLSLRSAEAYTLSGMNFQPFGEENTSSFGSSSAVVWKVTLSGEDNSLTELLLDDATQVILSISHWSPVSKTESIAEKQAALSTFAKAFTEFCESSYNLTEGSAFLASYPDRAEVSFLTADEQPISFSLTLSGYSFSFSVKETAD